MGSAGEINGRHWLGDQPSQNGLYKTRKRLLELLIQASQKQRSNLYGRTPNFSRLQVQVEGASA
jgi:hypothetical protein